MRHGAAARALAVTLALAARALAQGTPADQATLGEENARTAEVSTAELRRILADGSATVFDARPPLEFAISHIPGARNVAPRPGVAKAAYVSDVAEIGRVLGGDKAAPIVLYCNGPHCGKSKRLADELLAAGYRSVRRYQLGIPVWRALGGVCQTEPEGLRHVLAHDRTAVLVDAREREAFARGSLPGARSIPRRLVLDGKDVGEVRRAKDDGRLPMDDHNTRLIVVGATADEAAFVANAIAREAFHNVSYFAGRFEEALTAALTHVVSADLQVRELRPGVWLHTSWRVLDDGTRFPSNGLLVKERDHLLLVDTAWGEPLTEELLDWIDANLKRPVRAAVVTHFHDDRLGGAAALARRGIPFHGHPLTAELAATVRLPPPRVLSGLAKAGGVARLGSAEVFYPGPAHTRDNVVVWLPESRVLAGGCAVRAAGATALGNVADADVPSWAESIRRARRRHPQAEVVVPGHGQPGGRELLEHTIGLAQAGK